VSEARRIAQLLDQRASVFIYADHQHLLVGSDGVEKFSEVFGRNATLVLLLYRDDWGTTGWTSIEKAAINSRRVQERTDEFLTVVKMEDARTPSWLPASRIYGEWSSFGAEGVCGAVITRLQELGKRVRPETPVDVARRIAEAAAWEEKRRQLSYDRLASDKESLRVFAKLEAVAREAECALSQDRRSAAVLRDRLYVTVAQSSSDDGRAAFVVRLWQGEFWRLGVSSGHAIESWTFAFDAEPPDVLGWRSQSQFLTSDGLAEMAVLALLRRVERM
jgi:hypothetical protein